MQIRFQIKLNKKNTNLFIVIDDDGPGISLELSMKMYLNHFIKLIKVGLTQNLVLDLGLSISSDIIRSHGGNIKLEKSKMNGLRVKIFLPI